jgi:FKBP-type peptidyl-prolyl cis-trans isomerase FkpA
MKNVSLFLLAVLTLFVAASCKQQGFKKTKSGLLYKIFSDKKGELVKKGQFMKMEVVEKVHDSLLYSSVNSMPAYVRVDSSRNDYSPGEIFPLLRKGDSVLIVEIGDTLRRKFGQLPPFIRKGDKITLAFKVTDVFISEEMVTADRNNEVEKQKQRERKLVEDYLADKKINAAKTDLGTYVVVQTPGDGPKVDTGKQVSVRYTGKIIPTEKVFESNMTPPGNEPFKFVVGRHEVIQGWDDGLKMFKKGGRGTLYIPAYLAYDQKAAPGSTPYENLIFEIEIVDVTDAPPPSAQPSMSMPGMPGGMPGGPGGRRMMMPPGGNRPMMRPPQGNPQQH